MYAALRAMHPEIEFKLERHRNLSNNSGTTLEGSYWADQKDSHNEVIMTSLQGQYSGPMKGLGNL